MLDRWIDWTVPTLAADIAVTLGAIGLAILIHALLARLAAKLAARTPGSVDDVFVEAGRRPSRWLFAVLALAAVRPYLTLDTTQNALWIQAAGLIVPALIGWLAIAMTRGSVRAIEISTDISVADNLHARRRRTRSAILSRIGVFAIGFVTICLMLLSIPSVRAVGVTLMASAGIAGLAIGAAAQPALKNLIAGIQMAFTEPIRIDDVVIVAGEWGRIEEIRLTYVVVQVWDDRRLIVPVSKFLEESFENWTRSSSALLGTAFFHLDPAADIARLRAKLTEIVAANANWDGRVVGLQVTEMRADAIEARALVSGADAGKTFDLRADVREAMLAFIRDEMPEALPRERMLWARLDDDDPVGDRDHA
ncbi:mechanosensitive ion channel family protein [Sphingomonas japonica]|uniref:Small-conductance mechanosensitive channel n=1 Tax=Sphingomonas japonica TaxID=511662 RepID=A0ABX0U3F1_9SPHN|nr:mechanosensitive ion channel domain-containing protein [Sphingomonas japonica]NIJ25088.1 small-conductance mechanosensitive channel [Sphingomonas japonica]